MSKLVVTQKCFHIWLILIKIFQERFRTNLFNINNKKDSFYDLFFRCWVLMKSEDEILEETNYFIQKNKIDLKPKEYYWEYMDNGEFCKNDQERWIWMYNSVVKEMLAKESKDTQDYFNLHYSPEEIEFQLNWNDELFD
jgi:hypothetical protein